MDNEFYIRRTFELAKKGLGLTWPNPLVGAVIVKNGKVIGEGFHQKFGGPHAEVHALNSCTESAEGSTIYVNLEPCCHTKKLTPPCAQRLVLEKIKKVVICNLDPNPAVNGKGVELLKDHGIEVEYGVLKELGDELNEVFFLAQIKKRPFIHLKLATTLDGKIALPNGESKWITGEAARLKVQELRSVHQAIVVGAGTLRLDNPKLNVRLSDYQGLQPLRVVFTESGNIDPTAQIFVDENRKNTIVYTKTALKKSDIESVMIGSIEDALSDMFEKRNIVSVFLEGGSALASAFMARNLVDRVSLFINPSFLGAGKSVMNDYGLKQLGLRQKLKNVKTEWVDGDLYLTGKY